MIYGVCGVQPCWFWPKSTFEKSMCLFGAGHCIVIQLRFIGSDTLTKSAMPITRIPNRTSKRILWIAFSTIRILVVICAIAYFFVALLEFTSNKEVIHLTMFSMFILCANFQLSIGGYGAVIIKENSAKIFMLSMFTLSAAFLALADLGLDQVLKQLKAANLSQYYLALNGIESIIEIIGVLIFCYSLDRFMAFLKLKTLELKNVVH